MGAAVAHPISPELVLVCPELREHALTLLPAVDPEELFSVEPRQAAPVAERPVLALVEAVEPAEPVEPVEPVKPVPAADPERRAPLPLALVAYLTEAIFLSAVRGAALTALIVVLAFVLAR